MLWELLDGLNEWGDLLRAPGVELSNVKAPLLAGEKSKAEESLSR